MNGPRQPTLTRAILFEGVAGTLLVLAAHGWFTSGHVHTASAALSEIEAAGERSAPVVTPASVLAAQESIERARAKFRDESALYHAYTAAAEQAGVTLEQVAPERIDVARLLPEAETDPDEASRLAAGDVGVRVTSTVRGPYAAVTRFVASITGEPMGVQVVSVLIVPDPANPEWVIASMVANHFAIAQPSGPQSQGATP